ncbi:Ankyrin repeat domain-containing protein 50 [Pleurostoma richardsiae]|uniref:Ankyrin repeat domain-containing protein 50 n=1 Tax=Pleurostoma richardsiae TaxID=41990 RepID=A0AA38RYK2_9PEZI|nr:Ankyrin repeat domain-containing protein 50 [Pleurostoma richardsiae]
MVFELQGRGLSGSFSSLWNIFERIISDPKLGPVYVVVDALDECIDLKTRDLFLESIGKLAQDVDSRITPNKCVKFLLTSRPSLSEKYVLHGALCSRLPIDQTHSGFCDDVRLVIQSKVSQISQRYDWSPGLKDHLQQTLLERADNTFLWVHMILQSFEETLDTAKGDFAAIVNQLPRGLKSTYENFLTGIPKGYEDKASKLLKLILGSSRYLSLDEINLAFSVTPAERTTQDVQSNCQTSMARLLQGVLGPLVRIIEAKVSLVHQSAKDFLLQLALERDNQLSQVYGVHEAVAALTIATSSIHYLLLEDFSVDLFSVVDSPVESLSESIEADESWGADLLVEHDPASLAGDNIFTDSRYLDEEKCQTIAGQHRFLGYSSLNWAEHYAAAQDLATPELQQAAMTLLDPNSASCTNWLRYYWLESRQEQDLPPDIDALSLAAHFDIRHALIQILEKDTSYPQSGKDRAVFWASRMGHSKSVEILLQAGAEPNQQTADRLTTLTVAAQSGHLDAVEVLLLEERTDINMRGRSGRTALSFACGNGHLDVIEALLKRYDNRPDEPDNAGWTPLFWAVGGGHTRVISRLLEHSSVDINHRDKDGRTIASWAAGDGMSALLEHLLKTTNVDPNVADKHGRSPLSWAAGNGHVGTAVALLRDGRVDKTTLDIDERGAVSWACGNGHEAVLRVLIKAKCPGLDDIDADGWTPLMWAIQKNSPGTVKSLLSTGALQIDKRDRSGRTALSWAVEYGHADVVRVLIENDADVQSTSNEGKTPLSVAAAFGRDDIFELLQAKITP